MYRMRRILWTESGFSPTGFEGAGARRTSRAASSANFASRTRESWKASVAMLWLWRSRGREVMLERWVRRWMWRVCCEEGEGRAM